MVLTWYYNGMEQYEYIFRLQKAGQHFHVYAMASSFEKARATVKRKMKGYRIVEQIRTDVSEYRLDVWGIESLPRAI